MQTSNKRQNFLNDFLKLFGAKSIKLTKIETDKVYGTVVYNANDSDEQQDFCWHMTEQDTPSDEVLNLIRIIEENNFIDIDKLKVPLTEIFEKTNENNFNNFLMTVEALMNVQVHMLDNGEETDSYFIHD